MSSRDPGTDPRSPDDLEVAAEDDLDELRGRGRGRWWLALLLVILLAVPASGMLFDELDFSRSASEVEQQLGSGDPLLDAVLLVRTVRCDGQVATGSAFALEVDGEPVLVTNRHVVDRASTIAVRSLDGSTTQRVSSHRVSPDRDVAVLTLPEGSLVPAPLTAAESVAMGARIRIVGFPGGRPAATDGTVSEQVSQRLLLNVAVQQGSSGSPVVDAAGDVVGQVVARAQDDRGIALRIGEVVAATAATVPPSGC